MAIQISGTSVINDDKQLASGLVSAYDAVTASASGATVGNRTVYCVTATVKLLLYQLHQPQVMKLLSSMVEHSLELLLVETVQILWVLLRI